MNLLMTTKDGAPSRATRGLAFLAAALLGSALTAPPAFATNSTVQTVAAVQALVSPAAGDNAYAVTYANPNDGGGGWFSWSAGSAATVNPCTVFASTGGGTGRWIRQTGAELNVDACGADQVTDASTAINAAFALCGANPGMPVALSAKLYQVRHNLTSSAVCTVHGVPSAGVGGVNTFLDFTNDPDGGACWSIIGTASFGNFQAGNSVGGFTMRGNAAGNPSASHCAQGIYVSRVGSEVLHDVILLAMNGPCLFWGSTILSTLNNVTAADCGTSTTAEVEIDGETSGGVDVGGTTLALNGLNVGGGAPGVQAGVKIDRYGGVKWINGASEGAGIPLMVASKPASTAGVGNLSIDSVDFEDPTGLASEAIDIGSGWTGTAGRGVVNMSLLNNTMVGDATTITSEIVAKNTTNFYARNNGVQAPNGGATMFDFQGTGNVHEILELNDVQAASPVYVKVNGAAVADAVSTARWAVDNTAQPSTYAANTTTTGTVTLTPTVDPAVQKFTANLTGNLAVTLATTHATPGFRWKVTSPPLVVSHMFTVNGIVVPAREWIEFTWDGSAYQETAAGPLF